MNTIVSTASLAGAAAVAASSIANVNSPVIAAELRAGDHPDRVLIDIGRELQGYLIESEPVRIALVKACEESEEINARVREILNADDQGQKAISRVDARTETKYNLHENTRRWRSSEGQRNSLMDRALLPHCDAISENIDALLRFAQRKTETPECIRREGKGTSLGTSNKFGRFYVGETLG